MAALSRHANCVAKCAISVLLILFLYVLDIMNKLIERLRIERLRVTFTANGKREFVPRDQVLP